MSFSDRLDLKTYGVEPATVGGFWLEPVVNERILLLARSTKGSQKRTLTEFMFSRAKTHPKGGVVLCEHLGAS